MRIAAAKQLAKMRNPNPAGDMFVNVLGNSAYLPSKQRTRRRLGDTSIHVPIELGFK
jgi:hypothetical protein